MRGDAGEVQRGLAGQGAGGRERRSRTGGARTRDGAPRERCGCEGPGRREKLDGNALDPDQRRQARPGAGDQYQRGRGGIGSQRDRQACAGHAGQQRGQDGGRSRDDPALRVHRPVTGERRKGPEGEQRTGGENEPRPPMRRRARAVFAVHLRLHGILGTLHRRFWRWGRAQGPAPLPQRLRASRARAGVGRRGVEVGVARRERGQREGARTKLIAVRHAASSSCRTATSSRLSRS